MTYKTKMGSLSSTPSHMIIADSSGFSDCEDTTFFEIGKISFIMQRYAPFFVPSSPLYVPSLQYIPKGNCTPLNKINKVKNRNYHLLT